jgi:hypothetical protein
MTPSGPGLQADDVRSAHLGSLTAGVTSAGLVELGFGSAAEVVTPVLARKWAAAITAVADAAEAAQTGTGDPR